MNFIEAIEIGTAIGFACGIGFSVFVMTIYAIVCVCCWLDRFFNRKTKG